MTVSKPGEFEALATLAGLPPDARHAAARWLLALNEADGREQLKRDLRNARRRARRRERRRNGEDMSSLKGKGSS